MAFLNVGESGTGPGHDGPILTYLPGACLGGRFQAGIEWSRIQRRIRLACAPERPGKLRVSGTESPFG